MLILVTGYANCRDLRVKGWLMLLLELLRFMEEMLADITVRTNYCLLWDKGWVISLQLLRFLRQRLTDSIVGTVEVYETKVT